VPGAGALGERGKKSFKTSKAVKERAGHGEEKKRIKIKNQNLHLLKGGATA